ncbi:MAG: PepSY domain-containing protein [Nitrospirales bacterium]
MTTSLKVFAMAALISFSVTPAWALFETDKELAEKASVSMIDAIKTAETAMPGKPVEVEMGKDDGQVVYKIEIVDANRKTHKVYVNAMTGKIHVVKK